VRDESIHDRVILLAVNSQTLVLHNWEATCKWMRWRYNRVKLWSCLSIKITLIVNRSILLKLIHCHYCLQNRESHMNTNGTLSDRQSWVRERHIRLYSIIIHLPMLHRDFIMWSCVFYSDTNRFITLVSLEKRKTSKVNSMKFTKVNVFTHHGWFLTLLKRNRVETQARIYSSWIQDMKISSQSCVYLFSPFDHWNAFVVLFGVMRE
jgi:hypothetical protein